MDIQELAEKLQKDGISKGKEQADAIIAEANKKAEEILSAARTQEHEILDRARQESDHLLAHGKESLQMAARDALLQLQKDISSILETIVRKSMDASLQQEELLRNLITSLINSYRTQSNSHLFRLEVPHDISEGFKNYLVQELKVEIQSQKKLRGFRLQDKDGGHIEVTLESVQEALIPFLTGLVKELVAKEKVS